eukprot:1779197-Rhodomonas_salina.3
MVLSRILSESCNRTSCSFACCCCSSEQHDAYILAFFSIVGFRGSSDGSSSVIARDVLRSVFRVGIVQTDQWWARLTADDRDAW